MPLELTGSAAEVATIVGQVLLGGLFVVGGISHFFELAPLIDMMSARGVPFPRVTLLVGSMWQIIFGALLMVGILPSLAALSLAVFLIAATIMMLNFWDQPQGPARAAAYRGFQTNVAIFGGLLIAAA